MTRPRSPALLLSTSPPAWSHYTARWADGTSCWMVSAQPGLLWTVAVANPRTLYRREGRVCAGRDVEGASAMRHLPSARFVLCGPAAAVACAGAVAPAGVSLARQLPYGLRRLLRVPRVGPAGGARRPQRPDPLCGARGRGTGRHRGRPAGGAGVCAQSGRHAARPGWDTRHPRQCDRYRRHSVASGGICALAPRIILLGGARKTPRAE